jgi:hypothetical protein
MPLGFHNALTNLSPISFGKVGLISFEIIMLTTYLGSWAFIALIITLRFLVDFHLFLLEVIRVKNSSSLSFQTHLRLVLKLLPMVATLCIPPFEQLAKKGVHQLQENISKQLHDHSFSSILLYLSWDSHHACLSFCIGSKMGIWLSTHPVTFFFFPCGFKYFFLCEAHHVGPPPFIGPWFVTLDFWPTFRPHGDSPPLLHLWWGEDGVS